MLGCCESRELVGLIHLKNRRQDVGDAVSSHGVFKRVLRIHIVRYQVSRVTANEAFSNLDEMNGDFTLANPRCCFHAGTRDDLDFPQSLDAGRIRVCGETNGQYKWL